MNPFNTEPCDCGPIPMLNTASMIAVTVAVIVTAAIVGYLLKRHKGKSTTDDDTVIADDRR